jgi:hypothetical protein
VAISYATLAQLKARLGGVSGAGEDAALTNALAVASRGIDKFCHRSFDTAALVSARVYDIADRASGPAILSSKVAVVDDFHTVTGLVIKTDTSGDGTFATTWASTDYQLEPLNQLHDGEWWPYYRIRAVGSYTFSTTSDRAPLQVTAAWGWQAVPESVAEACLIVAEEIYRMKDAPFGVAGSDQWGLIRIRDNPMASVKLRPYQIDGILVG